MERLVRLAGQRPTPDPGARARARVAIHQAWRETITARERRVRFVWMAPALAAAGLILAFFLSRTDRTPIPAEDVAWLIRGAIDVQAAGNPALRSAANGEALRAGERITTAPAASAALRLAGGGELRMNGSTTVRFVSTRRFALDRGHIYVDTGAPAGPALAIDTALGLVRDIGTRFDVQLQNDVLRIRVREGAIVLARDARQTRAGAGQQLVASADGSLGVEPARTYGPDWDWISLAAAPFMLEGSTLESFLGWVERESGRSVVFGEADLGRDSRSARLHGAIAGLTPDEALGVVLPAVGLSYRLDGDRIVILREERRR